MKKIVTVVQSWCDYPDCAAEVDPAPQETETVEFWFYVPGRGRKPNPVRVEMCAEHVEEMKNFMALLRRADQKEATS